MISYAILFFVFIGAAINVVVVLSIRKLENASELLEVIQHGESVLVNGADYATRARWAEDNDFRPDLLADFHGAVGAGPITMAVWKNDYKKTFLSSYSVNNTMVSEFVTLLDKDRGLTTSNTIDSVLFPPAPGHFVQAFGGMTDLDRLFQQHEAALIHLNQKKNVAIADRWETTDVLIVESIQRQIHHVKSLPLWQLRGCYWYFIRRHRMKNKTIAEQYP